MMKKNRLKIFISGSNGFLGKELKKNLFKNYILVTPTKKA